MLRNNNQPIRGLLSQAARERETWWVAFNPAQIKTAVGNSGLFDPHSSRLTDEVSTVAPVQRERMRA